MAIRFFFSWPSRTACRPPFLLLLALTVPLVGQDLSEPEPPEWETRWEDLATREELGDADRLTAQTALVMEVLQEGPPLDEPLWNRVTDILRRWEASSDIEPARQSYVAVVETIGERLSGEAEPIADEAALREFLQRALTLAHSPAQEGRYLYFLAESWLRSASGRSGHLRRAELLLQQAASELGQSPPAYAVHMRLGELYRDRGLKGDAATPSGDRGFLSRAVSHFNRVRNLPGATPSFLEKAADELERLYKPELEFAITHRFLPENDVRLQVLSRNLPEVTMSVFPLPAAVAGSSPGMEPLESIMAEAAPSAEEVLAERRIDCTGRHPHDWNETELHFGDGFPAGRYGVRVEAGGLARESLLLVTRLEVIVWANPDGNLRVWLSDIETGQPVGNASVMVLDPQGKALASGTTDVDGLLMLDAEAIDGWHELHAVAGADTAVLPRRDLQEAPTDLPWVVVNPSEVGPGGILHWSMLAPGIGRKTPDLRTLAFELPDGSVIEAVPARNGEDWLAGSLAIPESLEDGGPLYARLTGEHRLLVSHIRLRKFFPLDVQVFGDAVDAAFNQFTDSAPLRLRLSPALGQDSGLPDFVRIRVGKVNRPAVLLDAPEDAPSDPALFESIFPLEGIRQGGIEIELPDLPLEAGITPMRVKVLPLDSEEPIGTAWLGLAPFRSTVSLVLDERIIRPGDSVSLTADFDDPDASGELVVYRETWESRYIHRKRGTILPESEYMALPDRALLGSAKTDYRLSEEGFLREEVRRLPLTGTDPGQPIGIALERPGAYRIDFTSREEDVVARYPGGNPEVWVIPEDGDLRGFRSELPRLIAEADPDGQVQILVLSDRSNVSCLVDLEGFAGPARPTVRMLDNAALFLEADPGGGASGIACRAVLVGERKSDLLRETIPMRGNGRSWNIDTERLFGLNPGVPFDWDLRRKSRHDADPLLWTLYPERGESPAGKAVVWQRELHRLVRESRLTGELKLSDRLPLWHPFARSPGPPPDSLTRFPSVLRDFGNLKRLFPEARRFPEGIPQGAPFLPVGSDGDPDRFRLTGILPNEAGRWNLSVFSLTGTDHLGIESWLLSTELPIRSSIDGPLHLRPGDTARLALSLENTTRNPVLLELLPDAGERIAISGLDATRVTLAPSQKATVMAGITAYQEGTDTIDISVSGPNSKSEAVHEVEVVMEHPQTALKYRTVTVGKEPVTAAFSLEDWNTARLSASLSPGGLFAPLWRELRAAGNPADPLYQALGDWVLWRVTRVDPGSGETDPATRLASLLAERRGASGGWTWVKDGAADPWLSSLIMWSLELFKASANPVLAPFLADGIDYLESALADASFDTESRLFALRALALPAFYDADRGPSRIQARAFLDFLHRLPGLSDVEASFLLQVARAYRFSDEVDLLESALGKRQADAGNTGPGAFWRTSTRYLVSANDTTGTSRSSVLLSRALEALAAEGMYPGWETLGGFLNLLAGHFWRGQSVPAGDVLIRIAGRDTGGTLVSDGLEPGLLQVPFESGAGLPGKAEITLESGSPDTPVFLALWGTPVEREEPPLLPAVELRHFREFVEETLFNGLIKRSEEIGSAPMRIQTGDTIRAVLTFDLPEAVPMAIVRIPVPAGSQLGLESIRHTFQPDPEAGPAPVAEVQLVKEDVHPLERRILLVPMPAGRHEIILRQRAAWPGTFFWPEIRLELPRSGKVYRLTESRRLVVGGDP